MKSAPNYRQGLMAGLIILVFFAGMAISSSHDALAPVAAGLVVGVSVAIALKILRSSDSAGQRPAA
jgi:hypothetical protein